MRRLKTFWQIISRAFVKFLEDEAPTLAAGLAFFTIFSLAPLLILSMKLFSTIMGRESAREELLRTLQDIIGPSNTETLSAIIENAGQMETNPFGTVLAFGFLIFGATTVFAQVKLALNQFWGVKAHQKEIRGPWYGFILQFLRTRLIAILMIMVIGALLGSSVIISTLIRAMQTVLQPQFPDIGPLWNIVDILVSLFLITLLFGMILKLVPDVYIRWRDVWVGAFISALLFVLGKTLIAFFISSNNTLSAYGAAGSVLAFLIWIFLSAQIFYFGAELTFAYAHSVGAGIEPQDRGKLVAKFIPSRHRRAAQTADAEADPAHHPDVRQD